MLPVLIYEPDAPQREALLDTLMALPGSSALKVLIATGSADLFARMLAEASGAALVVLGLTLQPLDNRSRCLELGRRIAGQNRDSYIVYCIHEQDDLITLLPQCVRPAGILLGSYTLPQAVSCFERILNDYNDSTGDDGGAQTLLVEAGTSTYRVPYNQILYIEALNKKLEICTVRQTISVRRSMGSLADSLPEPFIRCHRSYIVNLNHVRVSDFQRMELTLSDGSRLPIARSMRDSLRDQLSQTEEVTG